jgi:hypothetical protein
MNALVVAAVVVVGRKGLDLGCFLAVQIAGSVMLQRYMILNPRQINRHRDC